jgi:hypothetical protein
MKLVRVGLLERATMQVYVRARDPRRERMLFIAGCFYRRADPSRAHAVRRNVIWQSPFGFEIVRRYRSQLAAGSAIRWDARTVERARSQAGKRWIDREARRVAIAAREEEERDTVILADVADHNLEVVVPEEVMTERDRERWELAVAVAREREPQVDASELWSIARRLYATEFESLAAAAAELAPPERRLSRAEQFRRRRQSPLSRSMRDEPL